MKSKIFLLLTALIFTGCATVPKEELLTVPVPPDFTWRPVNGIPIEEVQQYPVAFDMVGHKETEIKLAWDPNQEPDLAGYRIYLGNEQGKYTQYIDIGSGVREENNVVARIQNLPRGKKYFVAVTAYNTRKAESEFSPGAEKEIPTLVYSKGKLKAPYKPRKNKFKKY